MGSLTTNYGFYKPEQTEQFDIDTSVNNNLDLIDTSLGIINDKVGNLKNTVDTIDIVGEIRLVAGSDIPEGFLACEGGLVSRFSYPTLFGVLGYTFGGSGSTFKLPDLQGRVPIGRNSADPSFSALGSTGGEKEHTLTLAEIPSHNHPVKYASGSPSPGIYGGMGGTTSAPETFTNRLFMGYEGGGQAHNNLPPYQVIRYVIKY